MKNSIVFSRISGRRRCDSSSKREEYKKNYSHIQVAFNIKDRAVAERIIEDRVQRQWHLEVSQNPHHGTRQESCPGSIYRV